MTSEHVYLWLDITCIHAGPILPTASESKGTGGWGRQKSETPLNIQYIVMISSFALEPENISP